MAGLQTFSPDAVEVIISNDDINHIVTNFAEGTFVSFEPATERFTPTVGARGEEYRAHQPSKAFNITLTLSQTSHSNDVFSLLLNEDRETLDGTFTMTVKDTSGATLYVDEYAYIQSEPTQSFAGGGSIEGREWMVRMPFPKYTIGGNGSFSTEDESAINKLGGNVGG
jgi:hypothetical protein